MSCWHLFPGFSGAILGPMIVGLIAGISYSTKVHGTYNLDPRGVPGAFEPLLVKYIRAAEFIIGLATGSIVLLVGSSALHAQGGRLPWFYASPLLLLGWSVILGVAFIVWLIHSYEEYQHENPHTKLTYTISEALGFSSLACFCFGYITLIVLVTR
jgi:hypothetical protein